MLKDLTWQFSVITVTIGFISNVIILINLTMKCLKVQRTRGSVFLALRIFYLSAIDLWKAKETITTPTNLLRHNELFHLIKNLNNLTDESSNDDTNSLNVSNKYRDPEYFCNLPGNIKSKSLSILHHNVCSLSKHFDQLHALDFDFIGITESRISKTNFSSTNIALANYTIEQTPAESNAGGALLYISRKHSSKIRKDLKLYKPHKIESVFV